MNIQTKSGELCGIHQNSRHHLRGVAGLAASGLLARIINFRPDKSVAEIETVQYLRELMVAEQ